MMENDFEMVEYGVKMTGRWCGDGDDVQMMEMMVGGVDMAGSTGGGGGAATGHTPTPSHFPATFREGGERAGSGGGSGGQPEGGGAIR